MTMRLRIDLLRCGDDSPNLQKRAENDGEFAESCNHTGLV